MDAMQVGTSGGRNGVVWEETPCPLCGASDATEVLVAPGEAVGEVYRVAQCRRCDMVYLNPRPDRATIGHFYAEDYPSYQAPKEAPKRKAGGRWAAVRGRLVRLACARAFGDPRPLTRWSDRLLAALAALAFQPDRDSLTALPFQGQGRLLDFGCGSGWYAKRMSDRGWTVTAMDFNPKSLEQVARRYGLRTLAGTLPHPEIADASFDVVVMGASLEHVHCPHEVVGAAARALRPGGLLVVDVPNFSAIARRWFGLDWWPLELPRHLLHFTPATLSRLMTMHGLETVELRSLPRASWMRLSLANRRRRQGEPGGRGWIAALSKMRLTASLMTRWTGWAGRADDLRVIARRPEALPAPAVAAA
jgi:2-polyprenyl-3-methyl-5-hydroxy-6-metoxy-1,4-benzoquinol methylase